MCKSIKVVNSVLLVGIFETFENTETKQFKSGRRKLQILWVSLKNVKNTFKYIYQENICGQLTNESAHFFKTRIY